MTFVQVIDCKTSRLDELNRVLDSWAEATKGKRTATHAIMGQDRSDMSHVVEIVEFPSYEEAMRNSNLPETDRYFQEMVALCDEMPSFTDLDVVRDEQLNKEMVQRFFDEVLNGGNVDAADALCTADYREHDPSLSSYDLSLEQVKPEREEALRAFAPQATVESMIAEGDLVCVRLSLKGKHTGDFQGIAATNRDVTGPAQATFRCEGGLIAESWWNLDTMGLMRQLGALEG
ncbi:ester cyclase [Streptomyces apocyni]|uniref:ester cyclase n=1 Tax=Streptomyces apocyni TaxID=2654677 RepID=UPI0012EAF01E|nr:ester cyclase [Streptomyces apocyni]